MYKHDFTDIYSFDCIWIKMVFQAKTADLLVLIICCVAELNFLCSAPCEDQLWGSPDLLYN